MIEEQYKSLHEKLSTDFTWPQEYMFKFIIASEKTEALEAVLTHFTPEAKIDYKQSSSGKYISVTINETHQNADNVVIKLQNVAKIEGVMAL
jgi:putative lipoic acid-binding regulatory protein